MALLSLRDIKRRIRSVQNTQQITRAMEMVAAAKLKRAHARVTAARPYASKMEQMLRSLSAAAASLDHPLFEKRPVRRTALVVVTADRGLAGSYNTNVLRETDRILKSRPREELRLVTVGRKGFAYVARRGWKPALSYTEMGDVPDATRIRRMTDEITGLFLSQEVDEVLLLYTRFVSTMSRRVVLERFLPIEGAAGTGDKPAREYIFEPSPEAIFGSLLPRYAVTRFLAALAEALASEHSARMIAMGSATRNADEMIDHLVIRRNRARQAAITKEIAELVGGAEALK